MIYREEKLRLTQGINYKITLDDCCIKGEIFLGKFLGWKTWMDHHEDEEILSPTMPKEGADEAVFEYGHIGPDWGRWKPEPVYGIVFK